MFFWRARWASHHQHADALAWLEAQNHFATCPIAQLGFIRVSMSPGYRASSANAQTALAAITTMDSAEFLPDMIAATTLPALSHHAETTDAYLVELARSRGLTLATLDDALCRKPWASTIAFNPLAGSDSID